MNNKITFTMENGTRYFHKVLMPEEDPLLICHYAMSVLINPSHTKIKVFISKVRPHRKGWKVCHMKYDAHEIQIGKYNQYALLPIHINFARKLDLHTFWVKVIAI